jgi:hypothetical protein
VKRKNARCELFEDVKAEFYVKKRKRRKENTKEMK